MDEEMMNIIRRELESKIKNGPITQDVMFMYLQIKMLDKLEEVRCCIIDVETEIAKFNPEYKWE